MPYLGVAPNPRQNREVDDISSGFNGGTTQFTLQSGGSNVSPGKDTAIIVSLGGVVQNPGTDYTIAASTITFTTAPASGLSFFGVVLAQSIDIETPADGTVTTSKIVNDAVTADKLAHTSVTAGSYTTADITVDAQGRITAASNGSIATAEIADNAVTTAKINADAVTSAKIADNSINSEHYVDGSIDTVHIADQAVTNAKVNNSAAIAGSKISPDFGAQTIATTGTVNTPSIGGGQIANRRININGAMRISQRGSVTGITNNASAYGGPDRYKTTVVNHGTYTASQESDAPDGFTHSLKIDNTSQDSSLASTARLIMQHKISKDDLLRLKKGTSEAEQLTVQFYVKSNKTGTYILELFDAVNNRHVSATYTISSSATWEQKTITFPADTSGALGSGSGGGIDFNWWLAAGSNFTSGSLATTWTGNSDTQRAAGITVNVGDSGYWQITGVQIEAGTVATDFEYKSFAEELKACQTYYIEYDADLFQDTIVFSGLSRAGTAKFFTFQLPASMRTDPTITRTGNIRMVNLDDNQQVDGPSDGLAIGGVTPTTQLIGTGAIASGFSDKISFYYNGSITGMNDTGNCGYMLMFVSESGSQLTFDAEI